MPRSVKPEVPCIFCGRFVPTRGHHVVPRCKGGRDIVPTCHSCEDFIHKTWSHNELRDEMNTVQKIVNDPRFVKFLAWLHKQQEGAHFRSRRNRDRTSGSIIEGQLALMVRLNWCL